jgi:hypothetical protein
MPEYEIEKSQGLCSETSRELQEGEEFYAVLFETEEGFTRSDYAGDAWVGPPEGFFSFWKTRVPARQEKKRLLVDDDVIINLFLRLEDSTEGLKLDFRFVLALILMRKRLLKYDQTETIEGQEIWQMRLMKNKSSHQVTNPRISDDRIDQVSQELGAILHGDVGSFTEITDAVDEVDAPSDSAPEEESAETPATTDDVTSVDATQ